MDPSGEPTHCEVRADVVEPGNNSLMHMNRESSATLTSNGAGDGMHTVDGNCTCTNN